MNSGIFKCIWNIVCDVQPGPVRPTPLHLAINHPTTRSRYSSVNERTWTLRHRHCFCCWSEAKRGIISGQSVWIMIIYMADIGHRRSMMIMMMIVMVAVVLVLVSVEDSLHRWNDLVPGLALSGRTDLNLDAAIVGQSTLILPPL